MKIKKSTSIMFTVFLISILICISTVSLGIHSKELETGTHITVSNPNITKTRIKMPIQTAVNMNINDHVLKSTSIDHSENIPVSSTTGDESYPSMGINHNNVLVAYENEDIDGSQVCFRSSTDYGQNWSSQSKLEIDLSSSYQDINTTSPSISVYPNSNEAFGSFISPLNNSGIFGYIGIPNIVGNKNDFNVFTLDWSKLTQNQTSGEFYSFWDFSNPDTICYDNNSAPWIIGLIGSTNYTNATTLKGPCNKSPMFCFNDLDKPDEFISLTWYPEFEGCSHMSLSNNYGSDTIFGVCEIDNGANQDVLFFKGTIEDLYNEEELFNHTFSGSENLINPSVLVNDGQIYIMMETDEYGDQEVIIYNSSDSGETWTMNTITSTTTDSTNPTIFVNETHIQCSYIDSGDLSITSSTDNGVTWNTPQQINDQDGVVVGGCYNADMADMDHLVWADNRNGDNDIYTIVLNLPTVDLTVCNVSLEKGFDFLETKNWISFTVKNDGTGIASNIHVTFSYTCNNQTPEFIPYTVDISSIDAVCNETKEESLFRIQIPDIFLAMVQLYGIENITVHVDPDGTTGDANPSNNNATISVSYGEIFPEISQRDGLMSLIEIIAGFGIF